MKSIIIMRMDSDTGLPRKQMAIVSSFFTFKLFNALEEPPLPPLGQVTNNWMNKDSLE
jgi:hypothetical protein